MDHQHDDPAVRQIVAAPLTTQAHALAAQTLATQAHTLATQALVAQAQVLAAQALVTQPPTTQAQVLATQAHALAAQAQVLAAQALVTQPPTTQDQVLAIQVHALAAQAQVLAAQALATPNNDADQVENIFAYEEIAILQEINLHYPFYKLALEDWERREKYLNNSVSRREGQSNDLTNQIYSIFGIFAVFQGVVLSAVSQLKQKASTESGAVPVCGKIWFPIVLTGFATMATLVGIVDKFRSLEALESTIHKERQAKIVVAERAINLRRVGPQKFKFSTHAKTRPATDPKLGKKWFLVILFFVIFTFIFIMSYFVILCDTWVS